MSDPPTAPSEKDTYIAGYNQPNNPQIIAAWSYDPTLAYGHPQDVTLPQDVDQQPQSGTQPQSVEQQPQSGTQPQNPNWQTPIYGQQTPNYGQEPPNEKQQPQNYGQQPPIDGQQPPIYEQQPQTYGQQPQTYGQQPHTYRQQPHTYVQQPQPYGQPPQSNGLQQQVYGEGQPYMGQAPTIQQPMNIRSNDTGSGRSDLLCPAFCVCLCCFWPTGIAAIIYASKAADAYSYGNIADGQRYQSITRTLIGVSVCVGIVLGGILLLLRLTRTY